MSIPAKHGGPTELPEGYVAIPLAPDPPGPPPWICVVARAEPDPVAGHLVVLRDTIDARVLLGCINDAGGRIHGWIEVWVQSLDSLADTVAACRDALSNKVLDERWTHHFEAAQALDDPGLLRTGWEATHPMPSLLDIQNRRLIHPHDAESNAPWMLCQDDALLASKDLPAYSTSVHRYIYLLEEGEDSPFVPVTAGAPTNDNTQPLGDALKGQAGLVPLNAGGGLMLVRRFCPFSYGGFVDLLSGGSWDGVLHGRSPIHVGADYKALCDSPPAQGVGGRLFLGTHGRSGRTIETFHLKLRLLGDAVAAVRAMAEHQQRPLLNLDEDSFQVTLGEPGRGLPFLWTARAVLSDPGDAIAPKAGRSDARYYLRAGAAATSVYRPDVAGPPVRGTGTVRIRKILQGARDQTLLEGTLVTQERIQPARLDLIWLRLSAGQQRLDLYAHVEEESALATGEWRFRTVEQDFTEDEAAALAAAEGVPFHQTPFELVPLLSTPCDLYGLGVLAVRTLLVDNETSLPVALDEVLSLARQIASTHDDSTDLSEGIQKLFASDPRWVKSIGPQRLTHDPMSVDDAFDLVPARLWWDTLAAVVRMFPAMGPDSTCRDFGDAPPGGIHQVFDRAQSDLDSLLLRSRSLIVIDWRFNREIHAVIRRHLVGVVATDTDEAAPQT